MENSKTKCSHKVRFIEKYIGATINFLEVGRNDVYADCISCKMVLKDDEIYTSLKERYELKVAKVIYKLFVFKRAYNIAIFRLEKNRLFNSSSKKSKEDK